MARSPMAEGVVSVHSAFRKGVRIHSKKSIEFAQEEEFFFRARFPENGKVKAASTEQGVIRNITGQEPSENVTLFDYIMSNLCRCREKRAPGDDRTPPCSRSALLEAVVRLRECGCS